MTDRDDATTAPNDDSADAGDETYTAEMGPNEKRSNGSRSDDGDAAEGHSNGGRPEQHALDGELSDRDAPLADLTQRLTDDRRRASSEVDLDVGEVDPSVGDVDSGISEAAGNGVANDEEETDGRSSTASAESSAGEGKAPLDRIAGDVRERRQRREGAERDPFEEMDVGAVDGEDAWEDLLSEEGPSESERAVGAGASAAAVETAGLDGRAEHVVPKAQFCGRCPSLGEPPVLSCENDGTEIIEVTDSEHFRVRGCPFAGRDENDRPEFD